MTESTKLATVKINTFTVYCKFGYAEPSVSRSHLASAALGEFMATPIKVSTTVEKPLKIC